MRHVFQYAVLIALLGVLTVFVSGRGQLVPQPVSGSNLVYEYTSTPKFLKLCGTIAADKRPVLLSMVYSSDKREWLETAAQQFGHLCPNIQLQLTAMNSFETADGIVSGRLRPILWSPSSGTALRYLDYRWHQAHPGASPIPAGPFPSLVRSPLIWLMADSRYQTISKILESGPSEEGPWMQVGCALVERSAESAATEGAAAADLLPGLWTDWYRTSVAVLPTKPRRQKLAPEDPLVSELRGWGRVKFTHANPVRSPLGFETLYLMAYDYLVPPKVRSAAGQGTKSGLQIGPFQRALKRDPKALGDWLHRCEGTVQQFRDSGQELVTEFFDVGDSKYDVVVAYEHVTLPILDAVQAHRTEMAPIRVMYPEPTIWADHPLVILGLDPASAAEQRSAAEKWSAFLLGDAMQSRAVELGFRPGRREASVHDYNTPHNPFLRLGSCGVKITVPSRELPLVDGEAVAELMRIWAAATGRY